MRELIESGILKEASSLQNISYILNDNDLFSPSGYKVLQGQEKNGFIKCEKLKYNGKIKLLYLTSEYKSFSGLVASLDNDSFMTIVANLLNSVIEIRNNGFLNCLNIDISLDKIFVDSNTLKTYLIYLPINTLSHDITIFENNLRTNLIKVIGSSKLLNSDGISKIKAELANAIATLENLYYIVCNECKGVNLLNEKAEKNVESKNQLQEDFISNQPQLLISSTGIPIKTKFYISKPEFIIGKNPSAVDGVITYNNAVSRMHCKIVFENNSYYVIDLGSANGTFLNSKKLINGQPAIIKNKDILKIANSEFKISIKGGAK